MLGESERSRQSRRFDSEKIDETRHTMMTRAIDAKICPRLARAHDLRPHTGIRRPKRSARQARPITQDRFLKACRAAWINFVIDAFDPLAIRTEPRRAHKVEREMHTQACRFWDGIDEVMEGHLMWKSKVRALAKIGARHIAPIQSDSF